MNATIAPTTNPLPAANGTPVSPVDYVKSLSPEDKHAVFVALLRELIEINGGGKCLIPVETPEGESLGYHVPPKAAAVQADAVLPKWTPEQDAEIARRLKNPGPTMTAQELIADIRAWGAERETQAR